MYGEVFFLVFCGKLKTKKRRGIKKLRWIFVCFFVINIKRESMPYVIHVLSL